MTIELDRDYILLINLDRIHCSWHVSMILDNLKSHETGP